MQSKKTKKWTMTDYVVTLAILLVNVFFIIGFCLVAILLNRNGVAGFKEYFSAKSDILHFSNMVIQIIILVAVMYIYFCLEAGDFFIRRKNVWLIFSIVESALIIRFFMGRYIHVYARPVAFASLLTMYLVNRRSGIFMNILVSLLMFTIDLYTMADPNLTLISCALVFDFTGGVIATYLLDSVTSRVRIFFSGILISLPVLFCVMGLEFQKGWSAILINTAYCVCSGMSSVVLMMVFMPALEVLFNVVTDFRLSEITDTKAKLLKSLKENALGTYNHSMMVASLAENCAVNIGENVLMARAAGYYHDIGKLKQPEFFSENQMGYNPHDELSPELSADIIRSHTKVGVDCIRDNNLPEFLADVCNEHHGTMPVKYFLAKAKKYTENEVDVRDYTYVGNRPKSKISAIIMICDASEAKVRSMSDRSPDKVDKAVREIIEERMDMEQFADCDITLKELEIIRSSIVIALTGAYHGRVKYPKLQMSKEDREKLTSN